MKKLISLVLAVLMLGVVVAGCGGQSAPADGKENAQESDGGQAGGTAGQTGTGSAVSDAYAAFTQAKSTMSSRLADGLAENPDTALSGLSLLGVTMADLALMPVAFFGLGEQGVTAGLGFFGVTGVSYSENGNNYSVSYADKEGQNWSFTGAFDPASGAMSSTASLNDADAIFFEYRPTSFGYVSQYYFNNEDGTTTLYKLTISGEDGVIGISEAAGEPAALTGGETADFPKSCDFWYAVTGNTITGVDESGNDVNFTFTPGAEE